MPGLGTLINVACILAGGLCGLLFGRRVSEGMRETLMAATGVAVLFLGARGALSYMLTVEGDGLSTRGTMLMIASLALGAVAGELLNLEGGVARLGSWLREKSGSSGDSRFISAFVSASCTVCIGAMAVVGSIRDGVAGDHSVLVAKGVLDAIIICVMAASQGKGSIFSAVPVGLFQGAVTAIAFFAGPFFPQTALDRLSFVGSILIFCVGLNLLRRTQIRVANLLPALVFAAALPL